MMMPSCRRRGRAGVDDKTREVCIPWARRTLSVMRATCHSSQFLSSLPLLCLPRRHSRNGITGPTIFCSLKKKSVCFFAYCSSVVVPFPKVAPTADTIYQTPQLSTNRSARPCLILFISSAFACLFALHEAPCTGRCYQ